MKTPAAESLVDVLAWRASAQPETHAFTFLECGEHESAAMTWSELHARARAIGAAIASRVPAGARVLLLFPPGIEFVPAFFGALYAGAVAVPAYPPSGVRADRTVARLRGMIADAGVTLVVSASAVRAKACAPTSLMPELSKLPWLCVDDPIESHSWRPRAAVSSTIALLQYTSGSTSDPRGVMVTHGNLLHNLAYSAGLGAHDSSSVAVSWLPVNHDMGLIQGVLQPVYSGFQAWLMAPAAFLQRPFRWLAAISRLRATHSGGPNFAYDLCSRRLLDEERARLDLSSWRVAFNGSEPIRHDTLEAFFRTFQPCGLRPDVLRPAYGLAEATLLVSGGAPGEAPAPLRVRRDGLRTGRVVAASDAAPDPAIHATLVSSGRAGGGTRIAIVDPVRRTRSATDAIGEIWVAGDSVARGYWRRPVETAATFEAFLADSGDGPFLRTGDLGFLKDGRLYVTGRIKDVLIVRGVKHYPQDLERTIEGAHAAVRPGCCAAFAIDPDRSEIAIAVEVDPRRWTGDERTESDRAIDRIRAAIVEAHGIQVSAVALLAPGGLPKTTSGKVQRFACREALAAATWPALALWTDARISFDTGLEQIA